MHIITLTKQQTKCSSVAAPQGDGAPDLDLLADVIFEHFSSRWGQDAPVSREEALLVASAYEARRIQRRR